MARTGDKLGIDIKLTTTPDEFKVLVLQAIVDFINPLLPAIQQDLQKKMQEMIPQIVKLTSTYNSLIAGQLKGEFGLRPQGGDSKHIVDPIIDALAKEIQIDIYPLSISNHKIYGGFIIYMIYSNFAEILKLPQGHTITEKNRDLHWLDWLLLQGNKIIIGSGGIFSEAPWHSVPSPDGRSGISIMVNGGFWKVPAQFAGTINNNWITRMIKEFKVVIDQYMYDRVKQVFYDHIQ